MQSIAIITHGGPIRCIFRELLHAGEIGNDDCAYAQLHVSPGKMEVKVLHGISKI